MRTPSRLMPVHEEPSLTVSWRLGMGLFAMVLIALGIEALLLVAVLLLFGLWEYWKIGRRAQCLSNSRVGEGICEFARAANCRTNDPWIVRAVYEELVRAVSVKGSVVPVRWDDCLEMDLGIDSEDLDMGIASIIAERTGRSFANLQNNPWYGKVRTAGDLVAFFNAQPFRAET
jgi:hypothetical protein